MHSCAVSEIALYETEKADSSTVSGSTPGGISNQPFIDSRLADFFKSVKRFNSRPCEGATVDDRVRYLCQEFQFTPL